MAAVVAIAGVALSAYQAQQQANDQQQYEQVVYGQRVAEALDNFSVLREREFQEREQAAFEIRRITRQARQAAGAAQLQALEAGVTGRTVDVLLGQFQADQLAGIGLVERNLEFTSRQIRAQTRANARLQLPRQFLGPFDTGAGIAGVGLSAVGAGLSHTSTGPNV